MTRRLNILKNGLYLFSSMIVLHACSSATDKPIPQVHHVQIKSMKFEPAEITVNRGDTIVWTNLDIVSHDVTEEKAKSWTSSPITMGKTWKMAAQESADYYCSMHVVMKGKIVVNK